MSKTNYMARANAKAAIIALAENVIIQCNANMQYTHDAAERIINLFVLQLGVCYNDTQASKGMHKLAEAGNNALTIIKSMDCVMADYILAKAKRAAADLKKQMGMDKKPKFEMRAKAKVEADDCNNAIQATISTKEGATKAIVSIVRSSITDSMLKHANSTPKGVDEYCLSKLFTAVSAAASRPTEEEMLGIKMAALCYTFDRHKSFQQHMEQFHLHLLATATKESL